MEVSDKQDGKVSAVLNWSGGKDSAHALWRVMQEGTYRVDALLTTVNRSTRKSTMHDIPLPLLEAQAERIGIPLYIVDLTPSGDMADYSEAMSRAVGHFKAQGAESPEVMDGFLATGLRCVVVTTMYDGLGPSVIGREVDAAFVASLPSGVDPNGENGEYHTFCYDGPIFSSPVPFVLGSPSTRSYDISFDDGTIRRYTYCFADLGVK